jgi:hypothetical protein
VSDIVVVVDDEDVTMVFDASVLTAGSDEFCFKRLSSSTCVDFKFLLAGIKWNIGRDGLFVCLIAFGGDVKAEVNKDDDGFCCIVTVEETGVLMKLFVAVVMKNCLLYKFSASDSVLFLFNA